MKSKTIAKMDVDENHYIEIGWTEPSRITPLPYNVVLYKKGWWPESLGGKFYETLSQALNAAARIAVKFE